MLSLATILSLFQMTKMNNQKTIEKLAELFSCDGWRYGTTVRYVYWVSFAEHQD